jgi:hypothetical protein
MLVEGLEGAGVQCVQRADTCSVMHWCALLSAGVYGWLGVRPVTRGESRASSDGASIFPGYPTDAAKNLSTIVVALDLVLHTTWCQTTSFRQIKGPPTLAIGPAVINTHTHTVTLPHVPVCLLLFLLPLSSH